MRIRGLRGLAAMPDQMAPPGGGGGGGDEDDFAARLERAQSERAQSDLEEDDFDKRLAAVSKRDVEEWRYEPSAEELAQQREDAEVNRQLDQALRREEAKLDAERRAGQSTSGVSSILDTIFNRRSSLPTDSAKTDVRKANENVSRQRRVAREAAQQPSSRLTANLDYSTTNISFAPLSARPQRVSPLGQSWRFPLRSERTPVLRGGVSPGLVMGALLVVFGGAAIYMIARED